MLRRIAAALSYRDAFPRRTEALAREPWSELTHVRMRMDVTATIVDRAAIRGNAFHAENTGSKPYVARTLGRTLLGMRGTGLFPVLQAL